MDVELTVKGEIAALHLEPGDIVVITVKQRRLTAEMAAQIREQAKEFFPDHEVLVLSHELEISATRGAANAVT